MAPSIVTLFLWMIVPLVMTLYFSVIHYNLMQPGEYGFVGLENFHYFITDPDFWPSVMHTLQLLGSVVVITVVLGVGLALLVNEPFPGQGIVRVLLISPFFVMPTVNALLWKHMMMNPIYGVMAHVWQFFGLTPIDWMTDFPLLSVIIMLSWQWLPFACLIFITSLQSLDREQMEAARMDGASSFQRFFYLIIPHLGRPMAVVIMIEMIFLLSVFAEIAITTNGGPGNESTNLTYLIFITSLQSLDREQMEAARMDGASAFQRFFYLTIPHLGRPMAVVIMIEMIFLLSVFAEIAITTNGGPGNESTNMTYLIFKQSLMNFDVGVASAGALFAVVLANIVAVFLIRIVGKNLD